MCWARSSCSLGAAALTAVRRPSSATAAPPDSRAAEQRSSRRSNSECARQAGMSSADVQPLWAVRARLTRVERCVDAPHSASRAPLRHLQGRPTLHAQLHRRNHRAQLLGH